ncbi:type II secretion system minor pseudopilin GspK [Pseudomonas sp. MRSN 12121]|uniref:type II secretion system minor pseudopilin GspK n=1 Tax=Pseudomonas sp. MRSN 12121 TaxID=1611770 RepID=UPI0005BE9E6C|nr:type II secretion system minor pseudopilin GspK [Pseudomonas sp. MRSN 12121]AJO80602.1 general secretion pathway protein GspK [Pseudomonas sp. MRSN 12121]
MVNPARQRGIALITVLLITSLATLIVSDMLARQRLSLVGSANQLSQQQLWQLALSGEAWARGQLRDDWRDEPEPKRVYLGQRWAQNTPVFDIDGGRIRIQLQDLGGRFNLGALRNPNDRINRARYQRLLQVLGLAPHDPARLPPVRGFDGKPLAWNDSSELMRLEGVDQATLQRLRPWVRTTPGALNLNTAPAEVLASLGQLDLAQAVALVQARPAEGYKTVQEFLDTPVLKQHEINSQGLDVSSRYFQAVLDVELGDRRLRLISRLLIEPDGQVSVLQRTLAAPLSE